MSRRDHIAEPHRLASLAALLLIACGGAPAGNGQKDPGPQPPAQREPDPTCTENGCIRAAVSLGTYSKEALQPYLDTDVDIDNGYAIHLVTYFTDGRTARATVTLPDQAPPPDGFHVVVNNPGTVGLADACAVGARVAGSGLAGLFGARGMIGAAVDYPGLGTPGVHPYLVRPIAGRASLDAARAVRILASWEEVAVSGRVAVVGTSQGGHAALAAAMDHASYAPELDVRAFGAAAPASVFPSHWSPGIRIEGPHLVYHALLLHAWRHHYDRDPDAGPLFTEDLEAEMDALMDERCAFSLAGEPSLVDVLGEVPGAIFDPDFLEAFHDERFEAYPFLARGFDENRLAPFEQTAPIRIYQGDLDADVPELYTRELVAVLRAGGVEVAYEVVPGGHHTDVAFGFVAHRQRRTDDSLDWLQGALDGE